MFLFCNYSTAWLINQDAPAVPVHPFPSMGESRPVFPLNFPFFFFYFYTDEDHPVVCPE